MVDITRLYLPAYSNGPSSPAMVRRSGPLTQL